MRLEVMVFLSTLYVVVGLGLGVKFDVRQRRDWRLAATSTTTATLLLYAHSMENGNLNGGVIKGAAGRSGQSRPEKGGGSDDDDEEEAEVSGIDYCTDAMCVKLYREDSRGEKGSAGAFLLLDRKYTTEGNIVEVEDSTIDNRYMFSQTSVAILRKRFGSRKSMWGEWTDEETRTFYKQQLPRSLLEEGALSLSLKERAQLAAEARHALRLYARERQKLPGRVVARCTDGLRHLQEFGYWSSRGMSWEELMKKYSSEARTILGPNVSTVDVENYCYTRIVERSCVTNSAFDKIAEEGLTAVLKSKISAAHSESLKFLDRRRTDMG